MAGHELFEAGQLAEAEHYFRLIIEKDPQDATAHVDLGVTLARQGDVAGGMAAIRRSLKLDSELVDGHYNLAYLLQGEGNSEEAVRHFSHVTRTKPDHYSAHFYLAVIREKLGQTRMAIDSYRRTLAINPDQPVALNNLAWLLATHPDATIRNGGEAVRYAQTLAALTQESDANVLNTLASAYAESGQFEPAVETTRKALRLLRSQSAGEEVLQRTEDRLEQYQQQRPLRSAQ